MQRIVRMFAVAAALILFVPIAASASNDPFFSEQWGLTAIGAEAAWSQGRGAGTVIAVIDTGIDLNHEDLAGKVVSGGRSYVSGSVQDDNGHGTHVAGIAAASTGNGIGVAGVAPDAGILPIKVLNGDGVGTVTDVAAGIRYAADRGADVINLSFGEASTSVELAPEFTDAIRYAWSKGAIPVVASGNDFVRNSNFTNEPVIVVTASSRSDTRPGYASGVGNALWGLTAPGGDGSTGGGPACVPETGIVSAYAQNSYACLVGTSMSVPHVSGAAAVLRGMGMSPEQVVGQLLNTADDLGAPGVDTTFGSGRLNLARAVQAAAVPPAPVPSTTVAPPTTAPPTIAAAPVTAPPTTESPPTTTAPSATDAPPTTESPTISLPSIPSAPIAAPEGQAVALLPEGDDNTRYVAAVPAGLLAAGMGLTTWRMRRQLPWR